MALKKIIALALIFALCLSCLAGCTRTSEISADNPPDVSDQTPAFVEKEDLYLYIRDNIAFVNEYTEMPVTILYGDKITGPIEIHDDRGQTLATLENDGSGRIETVVKMSASQERVGYLYAVSGDAQSSQATIYVQPHVTDEMVESTMDTGMQLLEHLDACGIDDPYSRETLDIVVEWLKANESVTDVVDTGSGILYTTTAGLACGYGFGNMSKDAAGSAYENAAESVEMDTEFSELEDVYSTWLENEDVRRKFVEPVETDTEFSELEDVYNAWLVNEDVRGKFVKSDVAITNRNILSLILDTYEDAVEQNVMSDLYNYTSSRIEPFAQLLGGKLYSFSDSRALNILASGDITDYGMLVFGAHGEAYKRSDKSHLLCFEVKTVYYDTFREELFESGDDRRSATLVNLLDDNNVPVHVPYGFVQDGEALEFWRLWRSAEEEIIRKLYEKISLQMGVDDELKNNWFVGSKVGDSVRMFLSIDYEHASLIATTYYLEDVLEDKLFDNTIVYLVVCKAGLDEQLIDMLFEHGASAVIANPHEFYIEHAIALLRQLLLGMLFEGRSLNEAYHLMSTDSFRATYPDATEAFVDLYESHASSCPTIIRFRSPYTDPIMRATGTLNGSVTTQDGRPIADADITVYHWIDHSFEEIKPVDLATEENPVEPGTKFKSDAAGAIRIENIPYGNYVLKASKGGCANYVTVVADGAEVTADPIVLAERTFILSIPVKSSSNTYIDSKIAMPTATVSGSPAISASITENVQFFSEAANRTVNNIKETQNSLKNPDKYRLYLNVRSVYATPGVASVVLFKHYYGENADAKFAHVSADTNPDAGIVLQDIGKQLNWYSDFGDDYVHHDYSQTIVNTDLETGETLEYLTQLLNPDNPEAASGLQRLIADRFASEYADDLYFTPDEMAAYAMKENNHRWGFTSAGLSIYSQKNSYANYDSDLPDVFEITIPYADLTGILADQYMPGEAPASEGKCYIVTASDPRFEESGYRVYGDTGTYAVAVDGTVSNLWVRAEGYSLYANRLTNALVWLKDVPDNAYEISWQSGGELNSVHVLPEESAKD